MAKRKRDDPEQSDKFLKTARELDIDESDNAAFEEAFARATKPSVSEAQEVVVSSKHKTA